MVRLIDLTAQEISKKERVERNNSNLREAEKMKSIELRTMKIYPLVQDFLKGNSLNDWEAYSWYALSDESKARTIEMEKERLRIRDLCGGLPGDGIAESRAEDLQGKISILSPWTLEESHGHKTDGFVYNRMSIWPMNNKIVYTNREYSKIALNLAGHLEKKSSLIHWLPIGRERWTLVYDNILERMDQRFG